MKKGILFLMLSVLTLGAWAQSSPNVVVIDDVNSYSGTETYVFSKADGKIYVHNNLGAYERYGVYERVTSLKVAGENINKIEYIATKGEDGTANVPYLNTGYIPKANTRIVLDVDIENSTAKDWMAVFGARQGGWTSHAFVLFARTGKDGGGNKGCYNRTNDEHVGTTDIPRGQRMTIDASGNVVTFTINGTEAARIEATGTVEDCTNNLYIFDTNTAGANGNQRDNSYCFMKLYGCQIYEGDNLVKNYVPVYNGSLAKGGMKDLVSGDIIYSSSSRDFAVSDDANDTGVTVYEGKMVYNTAEGKVYEYVGSSFVDRGAVTMAAIDGTEYKNMKNWGCPDGHWADVFGSGNNIQWNETNQTNRFEPYVGTGGWEPLHRTINVEAEQDYNVSFNYSTGGWNTWNTNHTETPDPISLPFKIIDRENYDQNLGFYTDAGLIGSAKLTNSAASQELISVDFTSTTGVARFIIQFGVVDDGEHNPAYWFSFDNWEVKKYIYPKAYPVLNPFGPEIEDLLPQVAAFDKTTTTNAIATLLDAAVNAAQVSLENPDDLAAQKDALENLEEKFELAKTANVLDLKATIIVAGEEGIATTDASNVVANGTTAAEVSGALYDLRAARKIKALRMPDIYTGSAPAAGKVYLFNLGTGQFLGTGSDWNTHAAVDQVGIEITLVADGNNFKMQTKYGWLNYGAYVDTGNQDVWHFLPVTGKTNVYNISSTGNDGFLLGYDPNGPTDGKKYWSTIAKDRTGLDNLNNQWKIITSDERATLVANASPSSPVDVSYLISNPSLNRKDGYDMWTKSGGARVNTQDDNDGNRCESYGWEFYDTNNASFTQKIQNIEPGLYEVSVNAFYRDGGSDHQVSVYNNGGDLLQEASLIANSESALLPNVASVIGKMPGIASKNTKDGAFVNWPWESLEAFETGFYKTSVQVYVGSDGELTLGISQTAKSNGGCWIVLDNFRLTYLGGLPEITIGEANYTTFVAPYDISDIPSDVEAYACQVQTNSVHLEPVNTIPEGEAVVLKNEGTYSFSPASASVSWETGFVNDLKASDGTVTGAAGNIYALAKKGNPAAVGFYLVGSSVTVPAGKGYLQIGSGSGVKAFYGFDDDDATGISLMEDGRSQMEDGAIYNLAGQMVNGKSVNGKLPKGIYIVNGKKILK